MWRRPLRLCSRRILRLSAGDVKDILLSSVDAKSAFSGYSVSGGRLNVEKGR